MPLKFKGPLLRPFSLVPLHSDYGYSWSVPEYRTFSAVSGVGRIFLQVVTDVDGGSD